jgi:adenylylsulfate kinase-like enzyme
MMGNDLGHTLEDRRANGWRMCRLCAYLDQQSINVVCATLSQFHDQQCWNRNTFSQYFEVFIDVPLEILIQRDQKGLYSGALAGTIKNVVGVDMPFLPPVAPDLVVDNRYPVENFTAIAKHVLSKVGVRHNNWLRSI